jgi:hypothetical protein|tara:strand:+ start:338 stop:457 length:120 start_codon:yes stop_codon:yes gene_type:complete
MEKEYNPYQIKYETKRTAINELDFAIGQKKKLIKETDYL